MNVFDVQIFGGPKDGAMICVSRLMPHLGFAMPDETGYSKAVYGLKWFALPIGDVVWEYAVYCWHDAPIGLFAPGNTFVRRRLIRQTFDALPNLRLVN
jgi:hypothetical protein